MPETVIHACSSLKSSSSVGKTTHSFVPSSCVLPAIKLCFWSLFIQSLLAAVPGWYVLGIRLLLHFGANSCELTSLSSHDTCGWFSFPPHTVLLVFFFFEGHSLLEFLGLPLHLIRCLSLILSLSTKSSRRSWGGIIHKHTGCINVVYACTCECEYS